MPDKDAIYAKKLEQIGTFKFDKKVADVFPDMLRRSVPGYSTSLQMIEMFARRLGKSGSNMYDLGSSLGAATQALIDGNSADEVNIFAVDNSQAMIERSRQVIETKNTTAKLHLICADIQDIKIEQASVVVLNYTLQFLNPGQRTKLIKDIYSGLNPGGALLLSEKIKFEEAAEQDFQTDWYYAFKEFNGYSQLEISQKRSALENVLIPETWQNHRDRLAHAGFKTIHLWHRFFSFASIIAIK